MKRIIIVWVMFFIGGLCHLQAQSFKIIVNQQNNIGALSKKDVSDLFLKKKTKWSNGSSVTPIDLTSNAKTREEFSQQIHKKGTSAIRSFWQQAVFSGTASAPTEKANDAEVIEFVKRNIGAIGYVSSATNTDGVKTISPNN